MTFWEACYFCPIRSWQEHHHKAMALCHFNKCGICNSPLSSKGQHKKIIKENRLWHTETHFLLFILEPGALHTLQNVSINAVRNPERLPNHQLETLSTTRLRGEWGTGSWWGRCAESLPTPVQASKSRVIKWLPVHNNNLTSLTTHIYRLHVCFTQKQSEKQ